MPNISPKRCLRTAFLATGALGVAFFATAAAAQSDYSDSGYSRYDNSGYNDNGYYGNGSYSRNGYYEDRYEAYGPNEEVEIIAPRYPRRSAIGAPIEEVSLSRPVKTSDLDLTTAWGARKLRSRVHFMAFSLCQQLDSQYPATVSGSPPCFRTALRDGMYQANAAISEARGYARD